MRSSRLAGFSSTIAAQIHQLLSSADDKMRFFVDWWQRMHRGPQRLAAESVKFIEWAEEGAATQRFLWEVCL